MTNPQTAQLEKEIAQLKGVIEILLEQNRTLKAALALSEKGKTTQDTNPSYAEKGNSTPDVIPSYAEKGNTIPDVIPSYAEKGNTIPGIIPSYAEKGNTIPDINPSYAEKGNRIPDVNPSYAEKTIGTFFPNPSLAEKVNAEKFTGAVLPQKIPPTATNKRALAVTLPRAELKYVSRSAKAAMAAILIHAHNGDDCHYAALKNATNRSYGGVAKLLISLRKKGWIQSVGHGKIEVTEKVKGYMRNVNWQMDGPHA